MIIEIAGKLYDSNLTPIKERTRESIMGLVQNNDKAGMLLRPAVKAACTLAMNFLGLKKVNRNDDPVEIVALFLIEHIFGGLERNGLKLEGQEILPPAAPAVEEASPDIKEGEAVAAN